MYSIVFQVNNFQNLTGIQDLSGLKREINYLKVYRKIEPEKSIYKKN
jgi:hypothetical protein